MPHRIAPRLWPVLAALLLSAAAHAHTPADAAIGSTLPTPATPAEVAAYAQVLGKQPTLAVTFGDSIAVAVTDAANGQQQIAVIDLYLKGVRHMPVLLGPEFRLAKIHLRGDMIAFRAETPAGAYDYLWDSEEHGPPYWKRTARGSGAVSYSPNLPSSPVADFYLRDPQVTEKLTQAEQIRTALSLREVVYIDGAVLIVAAESGSDNAVRRWTANNWVDAGRIAGVVNHHAVSDLNGDGLIEVLAGDTDVVEACTASWSRLYTWNAAKTRVVATDVRAESASNLSGNCAQRAPACFREESLTWDRAARPQPVLKIEGTQDTTGCPGKHLPAKRESYRRRFAWNAQHGAFEALPK
jgi:hypothetical protein